MAGDITLTASARNALLSLQNTGSLMSRTQGRLTTGLKVASAVDNAVAFFQAKSLSDRASDFTNRKAEIGQGISSLTAAIQGTTTADSVLSQMKGIVNSARTADSSTRATLTSQFNDLATQLNSAVTDASYQGLNLVNNSVASLTVYFNQGTGAALKVTGQNLNTSVLLTAHAAATGGTLSVMFSAGGLYTTGAVMAGFSVLSSMGSSTTLLDNVSAQVDTAVSTIRASAARLGGNVTLLQTRLDFTNNYINTMTTGSGKLTLADLNEEGANLIALQTRQQIGIQSLSIAGQQQQSILSLLH